MPSVPRCAFPAFIPPLRPSLTDAPPAGDGWLHEIKHDGFRTMLVLGEGTARAFTMNGHDWSDRYRGLVAAAGGLGRRAAVIDGEAVVQRPDGVADFGALREALARRPHRAAGGDDGIVLFAFDLLHLDGADFRSRPLEERRAWLKMLLADADPAGLIQFSEGVAGDGQAVYARSGTSRDWRTAKCTAEDAFVVVGAEPNPGGPPYALLARGGRAAGLRRQRPSSRCPMPPGTGSGAARRR